MKISKKYRRQKSFSPVYCFLIAVAENQYWRTVSGRRTRGTSLTIIFSTLRKTVWVKARAPPPAHFGTSFCPDWKEYQVNTYTHIHPHPVLSESFSLAPSLSCFPFICSSRARLSSLPRVYRGVLLSSVLLVSHLSKLFFPRVCLFCLSSSAFSLLMLFRSRIRRKRGEFAIIVFGN